MKKTYMGLTIKLVELKAEDVVRTSNTFDVTIDDGAWKPFN